MELFGIEKLSLVDFDGQVACTVFTGACNFRCGFCHNSPLVTAVNQLSPIDINEFFAYLKKRQGILSGVCITGGEPTLQKDLPSFCKQIKDLGYLVKVDTNGTNPKMIKTLHENSLADYFAMDIKNCKENYAKTIGINNYDTSLVEESVEYFLTNNVEYEFRTTLIKEHHTLEDVLKIGNWINGAKKYFLQKFKEVETCIEHGLHEVEESVAKNFLNAVSPYVNYSALRGY